MPRKNATIASIWPVDVITRVYDDKAVSGRWSCPFSHDQGCQTVNLRRATGLIMASPFSSGIRPAAPYGVESARPDPSPSTRPGLSQIGLDLALVLHRHGVAVAVHGLAHGQAHPTLADAIFLDIAALHAIE